MLILIGDRILLTNLDFQLRNAKITRFWNRVVMSGSFFFHTKFLCFFVLKLQKNSYLFYACIGFMIKSVHFGRILKILKGISTYIGSFYIDFNIICVYQLT